MFVVKYLHSKQNKGVEIAAEVRTVLAEIVSRVDKTPELSGEIAAASQEQAQGIDQINTAMSEIDKITQNTAANAEESASASAELNAQADNLEDFVDNLVALIGGSSTVAVASAANTQTVMGTPASKKDDVFEEDEEVLDPAKAIPFHEKNSKEDDFEEF